MKFVGKWQTYAISTKTTPLSQCASVMQNWLNANGFIEKTEWPSSSPGLNPLDYYIWGTMLEKYHKLQPKHKATDELKVAATNRLPSPTHVMITLAYSPGQFSRRQFSISTASSVHGGVRHWRVLVLWLTSHCCEQFDHSDHCDHLQLLSAITVIHIDKNGSGGAVSAVTYIILVVTPQQHEYFWTVLNLTKEIHRVWKWRTTGTNALGLHHHGVNL